MRDGSGAEYQLDELVVCGAVDEAVLAEIKNGLLEARTDNEHASSFLQLDKANAVQKVYGRTPIDSLMVIAQGIRLFQAEWGGLLGTLTMHAAIVNFQLEPLWHAETIPDSFIITTEAPTEGLSGTVPGRNTNEAVSFILKHAQTDPEFTQLPDVSIARPPLYSLLHIPYGAPHRSPAPTATSPSEKLIINAAVVPSFMTIAQAEPLKK